MNSSIGKSQKPKRQTVALKQKMVLLAEAQSKCPLCGSDEVSTFEAHHIDGNRHISGLENLIISCPTCHSKMDSGEIPLHVVQQTKIRLLSNQPPKHEKGRTHIHSVGDQNNILVAGTANVIYKQVASKSKSMPDNAIGSDTHMKNYVTRLIDRYQEYWQKNNVEKFNRGHFTKLIMNRFKSNTGLWHIPKSRFDELVSFLQSKIDGTEFARRMSSTGKSKHYSTYEQFMIEQETTR